MKIREYRPADLGRLKQMHAKQGFHYAFPDVDDDRFLLRSVLEDDAGEPVMAALARMTSEIYLLAEPGAGTPGERWQRISALNEAAGAEAAQRGLEDAHCWLPPMIEKRFGRRIELLGWRRVSWPCYWRQL